MADFPSSEGSGSHTIIPPTRRPDGSLRKPIRVRAGYVPQDEIGAWESPAKRMQREREAVGVPGWDDAPVANTPSISYSSSSVSRGIVGGEGIITPSSSSAAAALTKSQKRNMARKKGREEKRQQEKPSVEGITSALAQTKISSEKKQGNKGGSNVKTDSRSTQPAAASNSSVDDLSKKVKALQKKLRQVEQLQAKVDAGEVTPTDEQREKLNKRTQFEKELSDLQTALDAATAKQ